MKARQLIDIWRDEVDDTVEPYLWSDAMALEYLNDAINEAARRARLLIDSTTEGIATLETVAGTHTYELDSRVIFVRKARFLNCVPLRRANMKDVEAHDVAWEDAPESTPLVFIPDYQDGAIRLWPTPDVDDTLLMTVVRLPLAELNDIDDDIELHQRYQRNLRHWMSYRAYLKPDTESFNPKAAADALALFEQEFGRKSSAIDEEWINRMETEGDGTF